MLRGQDASPSTRDTEFSAFVGAHRVAFVRAAELLSAGDPHRAEDLVQHALTRAYVHWPRLRTADAPVAYVRRMLVNAHIDETRRPRWRWERSVAEPPDVLLPDRDLAPGDAVRAALAALPPRMRAAVVLRHWLDLSVEETAGLLGCTQGTVKSQTAKGVARLRELLGEDDPGGGSPATEPRTTRGTHVTSTTPVGTITTGGSA